MLKTVKFLLINFILIISFSSAFSSQKDMGKLSEIVLKKGVNEHQSIALAEGLIDHLVDIFHFHVTDSHFIYGSNCTDDETEWCRQDLNFEINFKARSVDLNLDGFMDVIVEVIHPSWCGSGGCFKYILINDNSIWKNSGNFRAGVFYVSDQIQKGLRIVYLEKNCKINIDEKICDFYKLEPINSYTYSRETLFDEERKIVFH